MVKECMLSTGKLPLGGLPRNSVVRIIDHRDKTSGVYCGQIKQNKQTKPIDMSLVTVFVTLR